MCDDGSSDAERPVELQWTDNAQEQSGDSALHYALKR